ncbi:MAG: glucose-6-phosphate dehydrogenase (NADP(+)), partial [Thermoplasmata archaeon]|nr:glucose-6-phosphate dehydrogenase (NADP(+)) [Thermoplasmata archaeon]
MTSPVPARHLFVVHGATGDLFKRKMLPSLYRLAGRGQFPPGSRILGVARRPLDDSAFRALATESLHDAKSGTDEEIRAFVASTLFYHGLGDETATGYAGLRSRIEQIERDQGLEGNRIFYLALPMEAFGPTLQGLGQSGLNRGLGWTRVVIEKPFGRDLASAQELNGYLRGHFDESQIYRIDHYLGKETVQNLLVFRFANMFVESVWSRGWVDHVEITVAEQLGVEGRAGYYEESGAFRDMVQNHVTQLLTLVGMEPPATSDADAIRSEKVKVLQSVAP